MNKTIKFMIYSLGFIRKPLLSLVLLLFVISIYGQNIRAGHEYVDLELPSGTLWATCNVGASSPNEYGDFFAWGETTPQNDNSYSWDSYKWCKGNAGTFMTKYCIDESKGTVDNKTELDVSDDAAYVNWGSSWCMPSVNQTQELLDSNYTSIEYCSQGIKITSKINGNSIFLPAAGCYGGGSHNQLLHGRYWTRTLDSTYSNAAIMMEFNCQYYKYYDTYLVWYPRMCGQNVRPVIRQIYIQTVSLSDHQLEIPIGTSKSLYVTVSPDSATHKNLKWESSDANIASVTQDGIVTGLKQGKVMITVSTQDGTNITDTCIVNVSEQVTSISINRSFVSMFMGRTYQLSSVCNPTTTNHTLKWASSDSTVASVDQNGLVTSLSPGNSIISITTTDGSNLSACCSVRVETGHGTIDDPYQIFFADDLNNIRNNPSSYYVMMDDINLRDWIQDNCNEEGWVPIDGFTGTLDGKGHTISGLFINRPNYSEQGLFAGCSGEIFHLLINDFTVIGHSEVGALAGLSGSFIHDVRVNNSTVKCLGQGNGGCGGVVGRYVGSYTSSSCYNLFVFDSYIYGNQHVGGLIGYSSSAKLLYNCFSDNCIVEAGDNYNGGENANSYVGGLFGYLGLDSSVNNETIGSFYSNGCIVKGKNLVGGVFGVISACNLFKTFNLSIDQCSSSSRVIGQDMCGGIVGRISYGTKSNNDGTKLELTNCHNLGSVHGYYGVGGIAGGQYLYTYELYDGLIELNNCIIEGSVSGYNRVSGVVGSSRRMSCDNWFVALDTLQCDEKDFYIGPEGSFTGYLSDHTIIIGDEQTCIYELNKLEQVRDSLLRSSEIYKRKGFDFDFVWGIDEGISCPYLYIEKPQIFAERIILNKHDVSLELGTSDSLSVVLSPDSITKTAISWWSSNPDVVEVTKGVIVGKATGNAIITATTIDGTNLSDTCRVTVMPVLAASVTFDNQSLSLYVNDMFQLYATVEPITATNCELLWESSDPNVVIISDGKILAVGAGAAVITASTTDGTNLKATCSVNVEKRSQTIDWKQTFSSVIYGSEMIQLSACSSSGLPITYKIADESVVSIYNLENVFYLNPGNCGTTTIVASQGGNDEYLPVETTKEISVVNSGVSTNKVLVAYYASSSIIEGIVVELSNQLNNLSASVNLFKVESVDSRIDEANYIEEIRDSVMSAIEQQPHDIASYPDIKSISLNINDYDCVIMVYPLWNSQMAAPMQTFIFYNKDIFGNKPNAYIEYDLYEDSGQSSSAKKLRLNSSDIDDLSILIEDWLSNSDTTGVLKKVETKLCQQQEFMI